MMMISSSCPSLSCYAVCVSEWSSQPPPPGGGWQFESTIPTPHFLNCRLPPAPSGQGEWRRDVPGLLLVPEWLDSGCPLSYIVTLLACHFLSLLHSLLRSIIGGPSCQLLPIGGICLFWPGFWQVFWQDFSPGFWPGFCPQQPPVASGWCQQPRTQGLFYNQILIQWVSSSYYSFKRACFCSKTVLLLKAY